MALSLAYSNFYSSLKDLKHLKNLINRIKILLTTYRLTDKISTLPVNLTAIMHNNI